MVRSGKLDGPGSVRRPEEVRVEPKLEGPREAPEPAQIGAGLARAKVPTDPSLAAASVAAAKNDDVQKYLTGKEPLDAAAYAKVTGISVSPAEAARLDAKVKEVAERMGLDHEVGFAAETKFAGRYYEYAFLGCFQMSLPKQPILIGVGLLAAKPEDIDVLYRFHNQNDSRQARLKPMLEDFLKLDETQRIQAILVHEHLELEAVELQSRSPHRTAVERAPNTHLSIDPRVVRHLELFARLDREIFGPVP